MAKLLHPKKADCMDITAYILPSEQTMKNRYPMDISVEECKKTILSKARLRNFNDYHLFYQQRLIPHDRKLRDVINTKTNDVVVLIQNGKVKMTFKFHQTYHNVRSWRLDVEITKTTKDIKSDVIQCLRNSSHTPLQVQDVCFSQDDRVIHDDICPNVGEVTGERKLKYDPPVGTYNVHVLPEGARTNVRLIPSNPGGKNYVVILPENATVRTFREEAAKMLQQSPGKLHFSGERASSGVADAKTRGVKRKRSTKDCSEGDKTIDFLLSPVDILSGWQDDLEIVIEKKIDDGPASFQNHIVHYDVDSREYSMTVDISICDEEHEVNSRHVKVHKFDSFSCLQREIGDAYGVDSKLVHFFTEKGRRIQSVHEARLKKKETIKAIAFKNGVVLYLKHHDNLFSYTCVVKDKEKVTVQDIRRNVERARSFNSGTLRVAHGGKFLEEDAKISSLGLKCDEDLLLYPVKKGKEAPEHSSPTPPRRLDSPGDEEQTNQRLRTIKRQRTTPPETCRNPHRESADAVSTCDETESTVERVQPQEASPPLSTDQRPEVQPTPGSHRDVEAPTPTSRGPPAATIRSSLEDAIRHQLQMIPYSQAGGNHLLRILSALASACTPSINEGTSSGPAEMSPPLTAAQARRPGMIEHSRTDELTVGGVPYFRQTLRNEVNPAIVTLSPECQALLKGSYPSAPPQLAITHGPVIPGVVTDQILLTVAEMLCTEWYAFCIHLQVKSSELDQIKSDQSTLKEKAFAGLRKWRANLGRHATNAALKKALEEKEHMLIAEHIPCEDGNPL